MSTRLFILVLLLASLVLGRPPAAPAAFGIQTVGITKSFPDAALGGALTRACAKTEEELRQFFSSRNAPFDPGVVRRSRGRTCHIDYEPTIPGFRADPDDRSVRELFINVDSLSFLGRRSEVFGDALDIGKVLVRHLPAAVPVTLGTRWEPSDQGYEEAVDFHFGDRGDQIDWRRSQVRSLANPWTQDYLKSGRSGGDRKILVTRRLFEGRREDGEEFRPMLDALTEERFVRSRLSWEGGDLQFILHPNDPSLLVLVFGDSAKAYWGEELSQEEYAYVLRREFGADLSIDLSGLAPHVDYFVAFLPADRIALVSQPMNGNRGLAEAAATAIEERFQGDPPAILTELRQRLAQPDALTSGRSQVQKALKKAKAEAQEGWPRVEEPNLAERAALYVSGHCPQDPSGCFEGRSFEHLLATEPTLLRDWAGAALRDRTESLLDLRLLSVVESQLSRKAAPTQGLIDAKVQELEELGFRVVRVPGSEVIPGLKVPWSGVSYVNGLLVDPVLFVPQLGLGDAETKILDELDQALPARYEIVPVPARHMILNNGGVHCAAAIVRE